MLVFTNQLNVSASSNGHWYFFSHFNMSKTVFLFFALSAQFYILSVVALKKPILVEIFRDDFNTDGPLNTSLWSATNRDTLTYKELGYYRNENARVENGSMILRVLRVPFGATNYTTARVETAETFAFLYGEVEWRAQIHGNEGFWAGLWISLPMRFSHDIADYYPPAACFIDYIGHTTLRAFHGDAANGQYKQLLRFFLVMLLVGKMICSM